MLRPTTDAPNVQKISKCPGCAPPNAKETAVRWVWSTSRPAPSTQRGSTDGQATAIKAHNTFIHSGQTCKPSSFSQGPAMGSAFTFSNCSQFLNHWVHLASCAHPIKDCHSALSEPSSCSSERSSFISLQNIKPFICAVCVCVCVPLLMEQQLVFTRPLALRIHFLWSHNLEPILGWAEPLTPSL